MERRLSRRSKWFLFTAVALALLVALTWNRLGLAVAMASSESRPQLLSDAQWGKPASAFQQRFGEGASEAGLLHWLAANHFEIDGQAQTAIRRVRSMPCNELIAVSWSATRGTISKSSAVVSEAGCL
jgi:hypothetical protein